MILKQKQEVKLRKEIRNAFAEAMDDIDGDDRSIRAEHTKQICSVILSRRAREFGLERVHLLDGRPLRPLDEQHRYEEKNFWGWDLIKQTVDEWVDHFVATVGENEKSQIVAQVIRLIVNEINRTFGEHETWAPNLVFGPIKDERGEDLFNVPKWGRADIRVL